MIKQDVYSKLYGKAAARSVDSPLGRVDEIDFEADTGDLNKGAFKLLLGAGGFTAFMAVIAHVLIC